MLDRPYKADNTDEELKEYLRLLSDKGPEVVIITSVPVHDEPHKTSVYAYNRQGNRYWKVTCPYLPAHYPGTGDTFTSVITGSLMQGDSLPMALDRATQFILQGIRATFGYAAHPGHPLRLCRRQDGGDGASGKSSAGESEPLRAGAGPAGCDGLVGLYAGGGGQAAWHGSADTGQQAAIIALIMDLETLVQVLVC